MPICAPRMASIWRSLRPIKSSPSKRMAPLLVAASTKRSTLSAVIDLPDPDSPTSANFSPAWIESDRSWTTVAAPKRTLSWSISSSGALTSGLSGVEGVAQRVADEGQQQHRHGQQRKGWQDDPPGVEVGLALLQQLAQRGHRCWHAQAEKI